MRYHVVIEDSAHTDLEAVVVWIARYSERAASVWYWEVRDSIDSLRELPLRCPVAPESSHFELEIRQLLHGQKGHTYRILFTVSAETVHVLHVRHGAMIPLMPEQDRA